MRECPKRCYSSAPPAPGKTLLARATAGEAKVPFLAIDATELVEGGASAVGDLFQQARRQSPTILFIDDLDAIGSLIGRAAARPSPGSLRSAPSPRCGRGATTHSGQSSSPAPRERRDQARQGLVGEGSFFSGVVNRLLIELDRLDSGAGVAVLAATNRPEILDPALLRAGRFEPVSVPCPDEAARIRILHLHTRNIRMSEDVDLTALAASTPEFTGADLARLVNKAALLATRRGADAVTASDFSGSVERILVGVGTRTLILNAHEQEVLAYHEVGHALLGLSLPGWSPVHPLSAVLRNAATVSCSMHRPTEFPRAVGAPGTRKRNGGAARRASGRAPHFRGVLDAGNHRPAKRNGNRARYRWPLWHDGGTRPGKLRRVPDAARRRRGKSTASFDR